MPYESYVQLIQQLDDLVTVFEDHPDPATREQAVALLSGLDALHREGLSRLVGGLREAGVQSLLDRVTADPVVATLLGLYDLAELDLPEEARPDPAPRAAFVPLERLTARRKPRASRVDGQGRDRLP